jgi:phage-related protein
MAVVGEGTVVVRLVRNVFRRELQDELGATEADADKSGQRSGERYSRSFGARLRAIDDSVIARLRGLESRSGDSGDASGANFGSRFSARLGALDERVLGMFRNWDRAGDREGDDAGGSFVGRFSARLRGLDDRAASIFRGFRQRGEVSGDEAGSAFMTRFLARMSNFGSESRVLFDDAGNELTRSFSKIDIDLPDFGGAFAAKLIALIPLIGVLGGGIAALIGGLTALAASAAYAAGSLAAVTTGIGALVLGLGTGFIAFSGITKAVQALTKAQNKSGVDATKSAAQQRAAADAIISAQQRLTDATQGVQAAEYNLVQARHSASEQNAQDAHSVQQAELAVADAQQRARDAQQALTQARRDAKSALEDLQLQLRGAVLSEEEATLRLEKARQAYQQTLNDPNANALDRRQAELDLEDAELALDEAKKRRTDVTAQTEEANRKGVEGSDQVVAAKKNEQSATQSLTEAEYNLRQARQRAADDAVQNAHAIAQAQLALSRAARDVANAERALAEAHQSAAEGGSAAATAARDAQIALNNLSPDARNFAKYLVSLRDTWKTLQAAAGSRLFGPLTDDLKLLVRTFFPALQHVLTVTGAGLADFFGSITSAFTSSGFISNFKAFADALSNTRNGASDWFVMGKIVGNIIRGITGLALAAEPIFRRFLDWADKVTGAFARKFEGKKNLDDMRTSLSGMADEAAKWGHIIGGVFTLIGNIISAALPSGKKMTTDFAGGLDALNDRLKKGKPEFEHLQKFFERIRGPFYAVVGFAGELAKQFLLLGENPKLVHIFDQLKAAMPTVEHAIETFTNTVAPALIDIIRKIIDVFDRVANSPAFGIFVGIMKFAVTVISDFIKVLTWGPIGKFTGVLLGLVAAFVALGKVAKVTGVKALLQSLKVGAAPLGSERALKSTGFGSFIQGARGQRVDDPSTRLLDAAGNPVSGSGAARTSNRLGTAFRRVSGRITPGGVATVATIGLALAPALMHGDIHGLKQAASAIGHTLSDNIGLVLASAAPQIISLLNGGITKAAPLLKSAAKNVGSFIKNRLTSGGGDAGGTALRVFGGRGARAAETVAGDVSKASKFAGIARAASGAMSALAPAMGLLTNPITLIIIGIAALAAGAVILYKHWKPFRDIVNAVGRGLKIAAVAVVNFAKHALKFLKDHLSIVLIALGPFGAMILGVIEIFKHWNVISDILKKLFSVLEMVVKVGLTPIVLVITIVKNVVVGIFNTMAGVVGAIVGGWWRTVVLLFSTAKNLIVGIVTLIYDIVTGKWGKLKDDVLKIVSTLWHLVTGLFTVAKNELLGIGQAIWNGLSGTFNTVKNDIIGIFDSIVGAVKALPGKIVGLLGAVGGAMKSLGKAIWNGIWSGLKATGGFVVNVGDAIINAIVRFLNVHVIGNINHALRDINVFGHRPFGRHTLPDIPYIDSSPSSSSESGGGGGQGGIVKYATAATGATVAPRPGGTLVQVAEAGRPESIVDTGLINARLRQDAADRGDVVSELRAVQALLKQIQQMGGINVEKLEVQAHKDERAAESVPRSLRMLQFEMGA